MTFPYRPTATAAAVPPPRAKAGGLVGGSPAGSEDPSLNWPKLIRGVLNKPARLDLVFQPIVSLAEAQIVGYEALARFPGSPAVTPDRWFAQADLLGHGAELESVVVSRCLELRSTLPPHCFLTVNVSPHLLTEPALANVLLSAGDLAPLVLELTEHQAVHDLAPLISLRDVLSDRGAFIALDDAGSGYSGLHQMATLRPHLIKLDRVLVADIDRDNIKLALAELLGQFAGRLDAWLLAEGVETWGELDAFLRLGVPLGQGYLLGHPAPPWAELDPLIASRLRTNNAHVHQKDHVAGLVQPFPHGDAPDGRDHVTVSDTVVDVAKRLLDRPQQHRFEPLICDDEAGNAIGIIQVERILLRLVELSEPQHEAPSSTRRSLFNQPV